MILKYEELLAVQKLGESIGYGHLMAIASSLWRQMLRDHNEPIEIAFVPRISGLTVEDLIYDQAVIKLMKGEKNEYM